MAGTATKALTNELGSAIPGANINPRFGGWSSSIAENSPDWRWPAHVRPNGVIDRMRKDSACSAVRRVLVAPVLTTPWTLNTDGCRPEVVNLVTRSLGLDRVGQPRTGQKGVDWALYLRHALLGLDYGHYLFEQVAAVQDGQYVLHKLAPRAPHTIQKWEVDADGGLLAVEQTSPGARLGTVRMGVDRLVAFCHPFVESGNWHGTSIYRGAFKHWLLRDMLYELDGQKADRTALGIPIAEVSAGVDKLEVEAALSALRSGANSFAAFPAESNVRIAGVEGQTHDLLASITHHGHWIAQSLLAHVLTLGHDNGARSLGDTFAELLAGAQNEVCDWFAETTTEHVIADVVAWNYGLDEPYPTLQWAQITPKQAATPDAIQKLVDAGVIIPDAPLDAWARTLIAAPAPDPATERKPEPVPVLAPKTAPAKAGQAPRVPRMADLARRAADVVEQLALLPE